MGIGRTNGISGWWHRSSSPSRRRLLHVSASSNSRRIFGRHTPLILMGFAVVFAVAFWWLVLWLYGTAFTNNPFFTLKRMHITAEGPVLTPDLIREYTRLKEGATNLFAIDIEKIRVDILRDAHSIKSLGIARRLPDTIEIEVFERAPIARLGRWKPLGIDKEGHIFNLRGTWRDLPLIAGFYDKSVRSGTQASGLALRALELIDTCNTVQFHAPIRIESVDISSGEILDVRLVGGERMRLRWDNMESPGAESRKNLLIQLTKLATAMVSAAGRGKRIAQIDLTFGENYVPAQEY